MRAECWEYRSMECLAYCQTQDNCRVACGLQPTDGEDDPVPGPAAGRDAYQVFFLDKKMLPKTPVTVK